MHIAQGAYFANNMRTFALQIVQNCTLLIICCNFTSLQGAYAVRGFLFYGFYWLNETHSCISSIYSVFMLQMFELRLRKERRGTVDELEEQ